MKIYDYKIADLVEISDAQYDFLQAIIKYNGRMEEARKEFKVSDEQFEIWSKDEIFKSVLESHLTVLFRSRGLTADYIKSYLLSTLEGKKEPSRVQLMAINASVKALGMGLSPRTGINGKITVTPESTKLEFNDGLEETK